MHHCPLRQLDAEHLGLEVLVDTEKRYFYRDPVRVELGLWQIVLGGCNASSKLNSDVGRRNSAFCIRERGSPVRSDQCLWQPAHSARPTT